MFTHYYRYKEKYISKVIADDERLRIVYPTDEHSMITVGHDFYVIGSFHGIEVSSNAKLKIELIRLDTREVIRTVFTDKKDNCEGMNVEYAGIETADDEQTVRSCGMPDLVYDPENPASFWYTWNKAYFTDGVFSALIYGGTCQMGQIYPYDQFGKKLFPIKEGYYELRVTLHNDGEIISSAKTVWFTEGKKEIILSRFSPDVHVERIQRFVREEGFESFTDPYAGIWDTQYFDMDWPVKAWVEIPGRWHFGDAQEYMSGTVHFFNYNISEACISWKTEIGTMIAAERKCIDDPQRLLTYFYKNGSPDLELEIMQPGKYFEITHKNVTEEGKNKILEIDGICKPLPADTEAISECVYEIKNRVAYIDYYLFDEKTNSLLWKSEKNRTGVISPKTDAPDEFLILHVEHKLHICECELDGMIRMCAVAKDLYENIVDRQEYVLNL